MSNSTEKIDNADDSSISNNKKRTVDLTTAKDKDDNNEDRPAKRGADASSSRRAVAAPTAMIVVPPMTPTMDPFTNHSKSSSSSSSSKRMCIIYLCCDENNNDNNNGDIFLDGLKKCQDNCNKDVHEHCFQMDGTRHISMWQGQLDNGQVHAMQEACNRTNLAAKLPMTIDFAKGWKSWPSGNYLALSAASTKALKELLESYIQPPGKGGKVSCDHLSLYRKRHPSPAATNAQLQRVRQALSTHAWGSLPGISIRIKVLGGPYDQCTVLAEYTK
jgi:hypothetical protein